MKNKLYQKIFLILFLTMGFFALVSDARADYYAQGILQSKNILSNATVTAINSFEVVATVPAGTTVSVKFSQDRVNYYNSAGVKDGWDSCADGTTTIDLSGLGWSQEVLFYKIKLETTDELLTPVVGQISIDYDGTAVPALTGDTYHQEGIVESKNILSGATVTAINGFRVSADIPLGTAVKVKFSQDGENYYSSAGVEDEWDSCVDGATDIDLSGLAWTEASLFYKIKLESKVDEAMTAKVTDAQIDYDGTAVPAFTGATYLREAYLVSTDLLSDSGITLSGSDYFGYGISYLPPGSAVYAQFSQDGVTWYSSGGAIWEWDTLAFGDHTTPATALSLSTLNWRDGTSFYYKLKFINAVDNAVTPIVAEAGLAMFSATSGNGGTLLGDPILDLNFNEGYGSTAYDSSGPPAGGNHGTLVSGATGTNTTPTMMWDKNGKEGGAMEFDGTDDYVNFGDLNNVIDGIQKFSVSVWIKDNNSPENRSFVAKYSNVTDQFSFQTSPASRGDYNDIEFCLAYNMCGYTNGNIHSSGVWEYWVAIFDGSGSTNAERLKIYKNGIEQPLSFYGNIPTATFASDYPLIVGARSSGGAGYFNGLIDEVKIYSYAISEDEIKTLYNDSAAMVMGSDESRNNNGTAVTGANKDYCIPGDTAKCDKPVLELKMNEKSGTVASDSSGNGNNGTLTNGPIWDRGKINGGLRFPTNSNYVSLGSSNNFAMNNYTIGAWVNVPTNILSGQVSVINRRNNSDWSQSNFILNISDDTETYPGRIDSAHVTAGDVVESIEGTTDIRNSGWRYISVSYDGTYQRIYLDGKLENMEPASAPDTSGTQYVYLNRDATVANTGISGLKMDDVKIYNYARTPAQIAWDYNQGKAVNHWTFDEGIGSTVHDEGASRNDGTITGATWRDESECKSGKCLYFDGLDTTRLDADTQDNMNNFTACAWINPKALDNPGSDGEMYILEKGFFMRLLNDGKIQFAHRTSGAYPSLTTNDSVSINRWSRVCGVYKGVSTSPEVYINGNNMAGTGGGGSGTSDNSSSILRMGAYGENEYYANFYGYIDDPKIYNYALTAEQIKQDYNGGAVSFE
ncbi:MAG: LamG domain-containing protein [Candidatus Moraniibacteriota bacterium]